MAGVNVVKMRMIAWLASALVAGLAGGIYAWYVSTFYPDNVFSGEFSIFAIVFALFGGVATITGPIVGVLILYGVYNLIGFTTPQYFQLIYGLLIMGLVLFLPAGLVSLATRRGRHASRACAPYPHDKADRAAGRVLRARPRWAAWRVRRVCRSGGPHPFRTGNHDPPS